MSATERGLTGLALVMLVFWELSIATIPLGLVAIDYQQHPRAFTLIIGLKLLLASLWLSRALLQSLSHPAWSLGEKPRTHTA